MSTPSPRPTREQVDASMREVGEAYPENVPGEVLAAEVRGLRAELERVVAAHSRCDSAARALLSATEGRAVTFAEGRARADLVAALEARTPQPAEPPTGTPADPNRVTCPHCPDAHRDPRDVPWGVRVADERDSDGQPTHLRVERTQGSHVAQSDADWLWNLIRTTSQPAVPDGEERPTLPPCGGCWEPVDPAQPHIVLLQQTEQHDPPGDMHVRDTHVLTVRHEGCS